MRPRGSIRKAVAEHMAAAAQGATWRDLAHRLEACGLIDTRAPAELALVRKAVENMKQSGEIEPVGEVRSFKGRRPLKLYGARRAAAKSPDAAADLAQALSRWPASAE